jgi:hypothetical protein
MPGAAAGGGAFNHCAHLRLALECLERSRSLEHATALMAGTLQGLAAEAGHPEKYHHTITVFWMRMLARLMDKELPLAYYSPGRLWSDEARRAWIEPDRQPLEGSADATQSD